MTPLLKQSFWGNAFQALGLMLGIFLIIGVSAWLVGGFRLTVLLLGVGFVVAVFLPRHTISSVMDSQGAKPLNMVTFPLLDVLLEDLASKAGLQNAPCLYRVPCEHCNAFAVGTRDSSAIAVTNGMLEKLEPEELLAVLAHEIAHIQSGDTRLMSFTDVLSRMATGLMFVGIGLLGLEGYLIFNDINSDLWPSAVLLLLSPILINGMQALISRGREYRADRGAVLLTQDPGALASALQQLQTGDDLVDYWLPRVSHVAHPSLLRHHPPSEKRVRRLLMLMADRVPPLHMSETTPLYFSESNL